MAKTVYGEPAGSGEREGYESSDVGAKLDGALMVADSAGESRLPTTSGQEIHLQMGVNALR